MTVGESPTTIYTVCASPPKHTYPPPPDLHSHISSGVGLMHTSLLFRNT